jgi:hypothetical protein
MGHDDGALAPPVAKCGVAQAEGSLATPASKSGTTRAPRSVATSPRRRGARTPRNTATKCWTARAEWSLAIPAAKYARFGHLSVWICARSESLRFPVFKCSSIDLLC